MDDWFTLETIAPDTFALSEYRHWEETHCYLLLGTERALLIDTGLGVSDIRRAVDGLTALPVLAVTTHAHWDHIGGHRHFPNIAVHEAERDWLAVRFPVPLEAVRQNLLLRPCAFPSGFDPDAYRLFRGEPQRLLRDGDTLDLGGRSLQVVHTPGHSPGHCCFYEPDRGWLYTGDLIYGGCLDAFYPTTDPRQFYDSVKRVCRLSVQRVLPAHHALNLPVGILRDVEAAFGELDGRGLLRQGQGLFAFEGFQIHL